MTVPPTDKLTTIELLLFSGDRVRFRRMELPRALCHRFALIFYLVCAVFLAQLRMFNEMLTMNAIERLALVVSGLAAIVLPAALWFCVMERQQRPGTVRTLNVTGLLLVFSGSSAVLCSYLAYSLPGRPFPKPIHFAAIWAWFFVLAQILAHWFLLILVRRILMDIRGADQDAVLSPTDGTLLDIKGIRVPCVDLLRVEAEGNYVRVITAGSQHFLPGPFGPVASALPDALGMRVSRSDWVARTAISRAHRQGRDVTLELIDGSVVRVAQAKRRGVLDWIGGGNPGASLAGQGIDPLAGQTSPANPSTMAKFADRLQH